MPGARLAEKVALVTGAASGIGRATAERLGAEGARVLCADLASDGAEQTAETIRKAGGQAEARGCDVADPAACSALVAACVEAFGRLDVLCNVAGVAQNSHATEISDEVWSRVIGVNLSGTFYLCRAALPHLLETRGNIVNMASVAGLAGVAYASAYCASKGGVVQLTKALAVEYAHRGVRVNCVCPGGVNTPLALGFRPPEGAHPPILKRMMALTETPLASPEEIGGLVAYLASDEARFVTGAAYTIDGGQVA